MHSTHHRLTHQSGWNAFRLLWARQALSLLGSGMTRFAVMIWAYERQGTATTLALLGFSICTTYVIASPIAGVLVDRFDRRKVMALADVCAGLMTAFMLYLYASGQLQIWHLYLAEGITGICQAFQEPAFSAALSVLLPRQDYTRANGLLGVGQSAARLFAPVLGTLLLQARGLDLVMSADLLTLGVALAGLGLIHIPRPSSSQEGRQAAGDLRREISLGFRYIFSRPGLMGLMGTFFVINLFGTITYFAVLAPMILARSGHSQAALGTVQAAMGAGGILGGVLVSLWKNPPRKARLYLLSTLFSFLVGDLMIALSRGLAGWSLAGFIAELSIPFIVSPYFALWQELVPADIQGRVFATREMVQIGAQPLGYLAGGLLADGVFEPALRAGGAAPWLIPLVGSGPGAGMAAMFLCTAVLGSINAIIGLLMPAIRRLDRQEQGKDLTSSELGLQLKEN